MTEVTLKDQHHEDFRASLFSNLAWVGLSRAWASRGECARRVSVDGHNHLPPLSAFIALVGNYNELPAKSASKQTVWLHVVGGRDRPVGLIKTCTSYGGERAFHCRRENQVSYRIYPIISSPLSRSYMSHRQALTCSWGERGNGRWIGKTSQLGPPSSSTNDSERLQKITSGAQSIHGGGARGPTVLSFSLCRPADAP